MSTETDNTTPEIAEQPPELPVKERQRGYMEKRPPEVDEFSSPTTIYIRTNIEREENEGGGFWEYDEVQLTPDEYIDWKKDRRISELEQQLSEIENILDMLVVSVLEE